MKAWKLQCPPTKLDLVFPSPTGGPMYRSVVRLYGLLPALRKVKLRTVGIGMHSLRHSFASALITNGAPINEVQTLLGHKHASTTLNVYTHWFNKTETGAVDRLAKAIAGQNGHFVDTLSPEKASSADDEIAEAPLSVS
jgi:integrase